MLVSHKVVEIDGINQHVADMRLAEQWREDDGERQHVEIDVDCGEEQVVAVLGGQSDDEDLREDDAMGWVTMKPTRITRM